MFSKLGLSPAACASLARLGYETPTPIQLKAIPLVLTGVDLLARAQTGTGKTAAFGLPMIDRLSRPDSGSGRRTTRGLVLVPTRELAVQVHQALAGYAGPTRLRIAAIFGGVGMGGQIQALRRGVDIVVATPGRLIDHLQRRTVDLSAIEVLTLDEGDRMLDMGFLPALRTVVAALPRRRQTLLFSATLSEGITGSRRGVHARRRACRCLARTGSRGDRDPSGASRACGAQARRADAHPDAAGRGPGARVLQDQARREPRR